MPKIDQHARVPLVDEAMKERLGRVIAAEPSAAAGYLFGSQAGGRITPLSDIDVGVLLEGDEDHRYRVARQLATALRREAATDELDLIELRSAPPPLQRASVFGEKLFVRNPVAHTRFAAYALTHYLDTAPLRRELLEGLKRQVEGES